MAFYFSRRKLRPKGVEDHSGELNIVPYLDVLMNLIIFVLLSMTGLAAFGILNVSAPNYGAPSAGANSDSDKPQQVLSVLISKKGFFVAGANAVLGDQSVPVGTEVTAGSPTLPKKADAFDFKGLTRTMADIKAHPNFRAETKVIVGAEADIPYEVLIQTMDAVREVRGSSGQRQLLFPDVTLAAM